jgi:DNA-binding MarR family transcriptional regulator
MSAVDGRTENLLAACSLALAERVRAASQEAVGLGAGAPAAVVSISGFLDGQSVNSLAQVLEMSHPGTVRLVDRLEQEGLVQRRRDAQDGREVRLVATERGRAAAGRILEARKAAMGAVLGPLDDDEREQLIALTERLLGVMTVDRHAARHICRLCDADACGHPDTCPVTLAH